MKLVILRYYEIFKMSDNNITIWWVVLIVACVQWARLFINKLIASSDFQQRFNAAL
jgi:hypothetical protein